MKFAFKALIAVVVIAGTTLCVDAKKPRPVDAGSLMKREETMVMNLNHGQGSTKFYLLESLRKSREMQKNLARAIRQVESTDATYNKARRRPDDRTMNGTVERLKQCIATSEKLEQDLETASAQLKSDIQSTLLQH